jgi:hypothetical protein
VLVVSTCFDRKTRRHAEIDAGACDALDVEREAFGAAAPTQRRNWPLSNARIDLIETDPQELPYQTDSAVDTGEESLDRGERCSRFVRAGGGK